jgi:small subunit ribosomal protein S11
MIEKEKKKQEETENLGEDVFEEIVNENEESEDNPEEVKELKTKTKDEKIGIAHITSSGNNTLVHITDLAGNTISRVSGGMITKHSRLKSNPTIAMFVAKRAAERPRDLGFTKLYVRMRGKTGQNHGPEPILQSKV